VATIQEANRVAQVKKFRKDLDNWNIIFIFKKRLRDMRFEIRKMIAESGKLRIGEAVAYVIRRMPDADKKLVRAEAKEMIAEAKRFNNI